MRVAVDFQDERLEFEVPDDRVVGAWSGPNTLTAEEFERQLRDALGAPLGFPPLRQAVVPGDRVLIPHAPDVPFAGAILGAVVGSLRDAGVEPADVTLLSSAPPSPDFEPPAGATRDVHDPADRTHLAYLASTASGRRVYLNRLAIDADVVLPVGVLRYDPLVGYAGPWSVLFPWLSDQPTLDEFRAHAPEAAPDRLATPPALTESAEVGWLLGAQFQLGVIPAGAGAAGVVAGLGSAVLERGTRLVDDAWSFRAPGRADLVVAGVGSPGRPAGLDELAAGLATAAGLVRQGGKIALLSRASGALGPALRRLIDAGEPRAWQAALRGHHADPDFLVARRLSRAIRWADVYLLSDLDAALVEDLAMVALGAPEEARRLAATAGDCLFVSHAESTRATAADD